MAIARRVDRLQLTNDGRGAIIRIRKDDRDRLEKHLFQRYPDREWGTFFRFGFRRTGWGLALSFVDGLWPESGDLDRQSPATVFKNQYSLRAFRTAGQHQLAVGVVHSHPARFATTPSALDDDMDRYFARELAAYSGGMPYISLIFQRCNTTGFTFSGRAYDRGEWFPVRTLFAVGLTIERAPSELCPLSDLTRVGGLESTTARLDELFSVKSAQRLRHATIGFIGSSGTGSPAAEVLARAGVGRFVLVDPQRAARSNLERMHGLYYADLEAEPLPYKVELVRRLIRAINPAAKVTALVGNALQDNVIDELVRCDAVLDCGDSIHGRVLMSDLAKHYLLPSLDVGVAMDGTGGKLAHQLAAFTQYAPDLPCAFCNGLIDTTAMAEELMTDEERIDRQRAAEAAQQRGDNPDHYWRRRRQIHTIGYLTAATGAFAAGYVEGWLTGAFSIPHTAFQFDMGQPRLGVVPSASASGACTCREHVGWADQARSFRNVARPTHWPTRALLLSRDD
jgi:ThiF family